MFKEAMNEWYAGNTLLAKMSFDELYADLTQQSFETCRVLGKFYEECGEHQKAQSCLLQALYYQYDAESMTLYFQLSLTHGPNVDATKELLEFYEQQMTAQQALQGIFNLAKAGHASDAYVVAVRVLHRVERQFEVDALLTPTHVELVDWMIGQEVAQGNLTQARFQLRKLLHLNMSIAGHDRLVYWAICLELVDCLLTRIDIRTIQNNTLPLYKDILEFYEMLQQQKTSDALATRLNQHDITDPWLRDKVKAIVLMIQLLLKKGTNEPLLQQLYKRRSMDFLIAKLYLLSMKPTDAAFWTLWLQQHGDLEEAVRRYRQCHPLHMQKPAEFQVTFLGGGEKIGGTGIVIQHGESAILLDAGMFLQEERILTNFELLEQHGLTLPDLDAVLVSHAHLDHSGSLPYIAKTAPHVPIFATTETTKLMQILLRNVVSHEQDVPYTERDIGQLYLQITQTKCNEPFQVGDWRITFFEAGHIVGAASILLEKNGQTLLFTGDFSVEQQQTCHVFQAKIPHVDVLITESTYGYMPLASRLKREEQEKQLIQTVQQTVMSGGTCLIPAFAVGRAQEILSVLQQHYDGYFPFSVMIDGSVQPVCDVYESSAYFELSHQVQNVYDHSSKKEVYQQIQEQTGLVIVASSGMLNEDSASSLYAYEIIDDPNSTIIFTGYLAPISPGYGLMKAGANRFKIEGQPWKDVRAKLRNHAMSAHVHRDDLSVLLQTLSPKKVVLMHGEHDKHYQPLHSTASGRTIYPTIQDLLNWSSIPVVCAKNNESYLL